MKQWLKAIDPRMLLVTACVISTLTLWAGAGMTAIYQNYDGPYYVAVAQSWYDRSVIRTSFSFPLPLEYYPAHFPLYPLLIDLASWAGANHLQAMLLVNMLAAVAGVLVIYKTADEQKWGNAFWVGLVWLFWWPRMWAVRSVGSPETLFILLSMLSLLFFDRKKYWMSGITGAAAVLTKSPGVLLLAAYTLYIIIKYYREKKIEWKAWPVLLIGMALLGLFVFFRIRTGDFWAYFRTGDNIHLGLMPFRIFDSSQSWVGSWWLEDVIWIYLVGGIGVWRALKKNLVWGMYGLVFLTTIFFVAHRDISRYSLPLVPVVLLGLSDIFKYKEVRWATLLLIIPLYFYSLNFVAHNVLPIANWQPLL